MCGVAGFLDLSRSTSEATARERITEMCDALAHRGPDGFDAWVDPSAGIALGHRRLSIIDLSDAARQPMVSQNGRYLISFNGEVYNFGELRQELENLGVTFRSGGDTEVMLAAISSWGLEAALARFLGMFAFALWDREKHTLSLARDRMGVKPMYWTLCDAHVLFGSELKSLMRHPSWKGKLDVAAITGFLRYSYIPHPSTAFENVEQVEPGSIVRIGPGDKLARISWWDMRGQLLKATSEPFSGSDKDAIAQLETLLQQSVSLRMVADVPLGAFLSGGIDSSAIAALMQAQSNHPIRTFSIGFDEKGYDEAPFARGVAAHLGTNHTEAYVTGRDALDAISTIPDWFDEPFADPSQLPAYLVARMAREHVTVALTGDGGDELFGGYPRYRYTALLWDKIRRMPRFLRAGLAAGIGATPETWLDRGASLLPRSYRPISSGRKLHRAAALLSLEAADEVHRRFAEVWPDADRLTGAADGLRLLSDKDLAGQVPSFLLRMRYYDMRSYLCDDILTKVDRTSMAVSLEAREPLLDHRVVEFAMSLPDHLLHRGGRSKWLLRAVLERYMPPSLFERPKMGFSIPTGTWLRGPLRAWAEALISPDRLAAEGLLNSQDVARIWEEHQSGYANRETILWNILMLQAWRERYNV